MDNASEKFGGNWQVWYDEPAEDWPDGLPMANGRIGAMICGGVWDERLYLSEITF